MAAEIFGCSEQVEPTHRGPARKGVQKDLSTLFDGLWDMDGSMSQRNDEAAGSTEPQAPARKTKTMPLTT